MTTTTTLHPPRAGTTTLTVLVAYDVADATALQRALGDRWTVTADPAATTPDIDIVICSIEVAEDAISRWPAAAVVTIAPPFDDGTAAVEALSVGADVCVRDRNPRLVAAYLLAVARRRGLLGRRNEQ